MRSMRQAGSRYSLGLRRGWWPRPEVDPARRGVAGISLGGIVAALSAVVDPQLDMAAPCSQEGDWPTSSGTCPSPVPRYKKLWIESGRTFADLEALTRPFDPLTPTRRDFRKRVLMIAGTVYEVIPPRTVRALW